MSNHTLEKQLDLVIHLLERLPIEICAEFRAMKENQKYDELEKMKKQNRNK